MNERIFELAQQANEYATTRHPVSNIALSVNSEKFVKKFAELLIEDTVRKCADYAEYQLQIGGTNADKIKQHFGVSE